MTILSINASDTQGGSALAAYRLHKEFLKKGHLSRMLVGEKSSQDALVEPMPRKCKQDKMLRRFYESQGKNWAGLSGGKTLKNHPWFLEADVVHYHSFYGTYFNYLHLEKLLALKPSVFTLHDMWLFTGHCSYSYDCGKWLNACGNCPYPHVYPSIKKDATRWEITKKRDVFSKGNAVITAPSLWLSGLARRSLLKNNPIHTIPNGIDLTHYSILPKKTARNVLRLPQERFMLLFGCHGLDDSRKGGDILLAALDQLPLTLKEKLTLLVMGGDERGWRVRLGLDIVGFGFVQSENLKSLIYSAADVFITNTRMENLSLMIMESMASGTPVIASSVGGNPDLIDDGIEGVLLQENTPEYLVQAISSLFENPEIRKQMGFQARVKMEKQFSIDHVAEQFLHLYQDMR